MNFPFFIAKRISFSQESKKNISASVLRLTTGAVALGVAIMIISMSIVTGFQNEIHRKIVGFMAHITVHNLDMNFTRETKPVFKNQPFYPNITKLKGIRHIQVYATKPAIIKTNNEIQGIVMKGIASDFDWTFLEENIIQGKKFKVSKDEKTKKILISKYIADLLELKVGQKLIVYFVQTGKGAGTKQPHPRDFRISGIYETGFEDFDKNFIFCDIKHIQKIQKCDKKNEQVSGFEIFIDDFDKLKEMTELVQFEVLSVIADDGSMLTVSNYMKDYPMIFDWLALTDMNVLVILIITFIVASFNMISGLLVVILERTSMIGILKSMGASNGEVKKIFLYNGTILAGKGIVIGNLIAFGLLLIQKYFEPIKLDPASYYVSAVPVSIDIPNILIINFAVILLTFIALLLPAIAISKVNPAVAVKFE